MKNNDARKAKGRLIDKGRRPHPEMEELLRDINDGVPCTPEWLEKVCDGWYIEGKQQKTYITHVMHYALKHNILLVIPEAYHNMEWNNDYLNRCTLYELKEYDFHYEPGDIQPFGFLYKCMRLPLSLNPTALIDKNVFIRGFFLNVKRKLQFNSFTSLQTLNLSHAIAYYPWNFDHDAPSIVYMIDRIEHLRTYNYSYGMTPEKIEKIINALWSDMKKGFQHNIPSAQQFIVENCISLEDFRHVLTSQCVNIEEEDLHI